MKAIIHNSTLLDHLNNQIESIQLQQMDVVVIRQSSLAILDHYVIFLGYNQETNQPVFIANYPSPSGVKTVQIVSLNDILHFGKKMKLERVRAFQGNDNQKEEALERAVNCLDVKTYSFVFNNCEHFANYVQYGNAYSQQTRLACAGFATAGALAMTSDDSRVRTVGGFTLGASLLALLVECSGNQSF